MATVLEQYGDVADRLTGMGRDSWGGGFGVAGPTDMKQAVSSRVSASMFASYLPAKVVDPYAPSAPVIGEVPPMYPGLEGLSPPVVPSAPVMEFKVIEGGVEAEYLGCLTFLSPDAIASGVTWKDLRDFRTHLVGLFSDSRKKWDAVNVLIHQLDTMPMRVEGHEAVSLFELAAGLRAELEKDGQAPFFQYKLLRAFELVVLRIRQAYEERAASGTLSDLRSKMREEIRVIGNLNTHRDPSVRLAAQMVDEALKMLTVEPQWGKRVVALGAIAAGAARKEFGEVVGGFVSLFRTISVTRAWFVQALCLENMFRHGVKYDPATVRGLIAHIDANASKYDWEWLCTGLNCLLEVAIENSQSDIPAIKQSGYDAAGAIYKYVAWKYSGSVTKNSQPVRLAVANSLRVMMAVESDPELQGWAAQCVESLLGRGDVEESVKAILSLEDTLYFEKFRETGFAVESKAATLWRKLIVKPKDGKAKAKEVVRRTEVLAAVTFEGQVAVTSAEMQRRTEEERLKLLIAQEEARRVREASEQERLAAMEERKVADLEMQRRREVEEAKLEQAQLEADMLLQLKTAGHEVSLAELQAKLAEANARALQAKEGEVTQAGLLELVKAQLEAAKRSVMTETDRRKLEATEAVEKALANARTNFEKGRKTAALSGLDRVLAEHGRSIPSDRLFEVHKFSAEVNLALAEVYLNLPTPDIENARKYCDQAEAAVAAAQAEDPGQSLDEIKGKVTVLGYKIDVAAPYEIEDPWA